MSRRQDDFGTPVIDAVAKRAAYICSNPECRAQTIAPSPDNENAFIYIGKVAHICAASSGGPRFNTQMTPEDRQAISNALFLCSNCAEMIDKNGGADFSVGLLRRWKEQHDAWVGTNLNKQSRDDTMVPQVTFHVTSTNQQGGITAGIVSTGPPPRHMNRGLQDQLGQLLPDKSLTVTIACVANDVEAFNFATEIKDYLTSQGYSVKVTQVVFIPPIQGEVFDSETLTLNVGTRSTQ